ncbi:putative MFS myo-inositol transporter [Hortaea werneckii]|nr:putative MFS myo-inositol transporter [Hortaea werneckii]KAI6825783.1 putative MFS myo-inositol transporter [Hortaea werneckii]KAI6915549.1 putative MFS myo-inositol transporter [Hortaea werneckii]KAI6918620.1 putative MFS myo-inositol transporter [Hortaea werneckii]KAI6960167.1 putative MFS myo-inositol transporter [Hortaea werneckii]
MSAPKIDEEAVRYEDKTRTSSPGSSPSGNDHADAHYARRKSSAAPSAAALLRNPLAGMTEEDVIADVDEFVESKGLAEHREVFRKGALLARVNGREEGFEDVSQISEAEKDALRHEITHRWSHPFMLYFLVVLCAGSAIVQGMDQTAVNGAQQYYFQEFDIGEDQVWMRGLLNGAPYLCSCVIGCWTNAPLNKLFGRRGTIFISCFISFATGFWMAAADSWYNLLIARFALGFAVGAKSSTTPVYAAECAPKVIRGALTMMWQMWTAFGIMLGFVASVAFQDCDFLGQYSQWRWMLGSTAIPPFFVMVQVYICPESPRWYMEKGRFERAYKAMTQLRSHELQAARDMYYAFKLLEVEAAEREGKNLWKEFFLVRRNRRAAQSSFFVMFMQQFCGVNVIAYYSTNIFVKAGFTLENALLVSFGTGVTNWLFAIPAIYTIDTFGRRNLLLTTFPLMALWLFYCGFSFLIPNGPPTDDAPEGQPTQAQLGNVATAIFLFMATYSPGEGPVPFTYSAEAFPLYIRDVGMSFATATCWGFNFILSLTWPALVEAFTPTGAFCWYAGWNLFGWVYCYFFLPETKNLTLEELDTVFNVGNRAHSSYYAKKLPWYFNKHILRRDVEPAQPLFSWGDPEKPIKSTNETEGLATRQAGAMGKDEIWGRGAMTTGLGA